MKKIQTLALLWAFFAVAAQAQKADTTTLVVFNTARNFMVTAADFGGSLSQDLIGDMVRSYDTVRVMKANGSVRDSSGKNPMQHQEERRCDRISGNIKDKIVVIELNKDCDVTLMCLNVQRGGAKALIIIHDSNDKKLYKLLKKGTFKDSIRIPIFTVPNKVGDQITALLPSVIGIVKPVSTPLNSATNILLTMNAEAAATKAHITWVNNTGLNNDFFIVQKLNPTTGVFEDMKIVNSHPIEGYEQYTTYDNDPSVGDNVYRIKLVFSDCTERYSELKTVKFYGNDGITLFPNPADDLLNISFKGYLEQSVDLTFSDMQGKTLFKQHIDKLQNEVQTLVIADKLSVGTYMIHVQSAGKRDVVKQFTVGK